MLWQWERNRGWVQAEAGVGWPLEGPGPQRGGREREAERGAGLSGLEGRAGQGPGCSLCTATVSMEVTRPAGTVPLEPVAGTF